MEKEQLTADQQRPTSWAEEQPTKSLFFLLKLNDEQVRLEFIRAFLLEK
ncbi:MAG: hypothetical protein ACK4UU_00195 [Fimbriimonadales bacterium]